ncbi:MAG: stress response translation initiation inhibitor YciH [Acidobacteriota bacterium]|nr:stress response translation initiation inhibitor YciH [Acidobacteriota bacterium]
MKTKKPRTVFSTETGRVCPKCGWPQANCRCSVALEERVPDRITARLRIEKAGRRGKTVTVIEGLPKNREFLKELTGELKKACGSGGKSGENHVEIQGDHREKLRVLLKGKGWVVKG